jgi:hypothetical protein
MGKFFGFCLAFVCILVVVAVSNPSDKKNSPTVYATEAHPASEAAATPVSNWDYESSKSEISGKPQSWACTTSADRGGAKLCFRRMSGQLNAYLQLPETLAGGQFFCYEEHCSTNIKVDAKPAYGVTGEEENSGNSRVIFLPAAGLLASAKRAKAIKIEAPFYSEGPQTLHFDVAGLEF